jgi:hypothetical protein
MEDFLRISAKGFEIVEIDEDSCSDANILAGYLGRITEEDFEQGVALGHAIDLVRKWNQIRRLIDLDIYQSHSTDHILSHVLAHLELDRDQLLKEIRLEEGDFLNYRGVVAETHLPSIIDLLSQDTQEEHGESDIFSYEAEYKEQEVRIIFNDLSTARLTLDPPWQRGDAWGPKAKQQLIISLLRGIPLPSVILIDDQVDGKSYMLDGKQRLSAIYNFMRGAFTLPGPATIFGREALPDKEEDGFNFKDCRGKRWTELPAGAKTKIDNAGIGVIKLKSMPKDGTYHLFRLYNTSAKPLSPVELRNATFHSTDFHNIMFHISGETENEPADIIGDADRQKLARQLLQTINHGNRFETLNVVEKYFGYSRAVRKQDQFVAKSAAQSVLLFYDSCVGDDADQPIDVNEAAMEIVDAVITAEIIFDDPWKGWISKVNGTFQISSEARSITSMILGHMAFLANSESDVSFSLIRDELNRLSEKSDFYLPTPQVAKTLYRYQFNWVQAMKTILSGTDGGLQAVTPKWEYLFDTADEFIESLSD